ncbi:MAG: hypothetical protein S4CHLAM37_05960 [Chlamydiia bacterium]|nr:hypothetical protein [Chlamydiia bacterium]
MVCRNISYSNRIIPHGQWFPIFIIRIFVGIFFAISGLGKLFLSEKREMLAQILDQANVPLASVFVYLVPLMELVFGLFFAIGLITTISSWFLFIIMAVATFTVRAPMIQPGSTISWFLDFVYLPEVLFMFIFFWFMFSGGGKASIDYAITCNKLRGECNDNQGPPDEHHHHEG